MKLCDVILQFKTLTLSSTLFLSFFQPLYSQENFGVNERSHSLILDGTSDVAVDVFVERVEKYNTHHKDLSFFLQAFPEESDRRFVKGYLESAKIKELPAFSFHQGRVRFVYPFLTVELGPIEVFERKIILDGRHYQLDLSGGPRVQAIKLKKLIEEHLEGRESGVKKFRNYFSSLGSAVGEFIWSSLGELSLISSAHAIADPSSGAVPTQESIRAKVQSVIEYSPEKTTRVEEVVAALLIVNHYLNFNTNPDSVQLTENIKKLAATIRLKRFQCDRDLNEKQGPIAEAQPINRYHDTYPMLMKIKSVNLKYKPSIQEMKDALRTHLNTNYEERENPHFCEETFAKAFSTVTEQQELKNLCSDLNGLKECSIEFLTLNRINESPIFEFDRSPSNIAETERAAPIQSARVGEQR